MKNIILASLATLLAGSAAAQRVVAHHAPVSSATYCDASLAGRFTAAAKTTAAGDTFTLHYTPTTAIGVAFPVGPDSGYFTGANIYGDRGFAERYTFNGADSSMRVIGVLARFKGTATAGSSKTIAIKAWRGGASEMVTATRYYSGFPTAELNSKTVSINNIGLNPGSGTDTLKYYAFDTLSPSVSGPFFVGFGMDYDFSTLAGDTVSIAATPNGTRVTSPYWLTAITNADGDTLAVDTIINVQNATQWSDNKWHDNYTDNDSLDNHLMAYPVVLIAGPTAVGNIVRNDLTLFGLYPNPTSSVAHIKYALALASDVTIDILDMTGRMVHSVTTKAAAPGTHTTEVDLSGLANGAYLCLLRTAAGDGIAAKIQVAR